MLGFGGDGWIVVVTHEATMRWVGGTLEAFEGFGVGARFGASATRMEVIVTDGAPEHVVRFMADGAGESLRDALHEVVLLELEAKHFFKRLRFFGLSYDGW